MYPFVPVAGTAGNKKPAVRYGGFGKSINHQIRRCLHARLATIIATLQHAALRACFPIHIPGPESIVPNNAVSSRFCQPSSLRTKEWAEVKSVVGIGAETLDFLKLWQGSCRLDII
jgi:hypothetical protein